MLQCNSVKMGDGEWKSGKGRTFFDEGLSYGLRKLNPTELLVRYLINPPLLIVNIIFKHKSSGEVDSMGNLVNKNTYNERNFEIMFFILNDNILIFLKKKNKRKGERMKNERGPDKMVC